MYKLDWHPEYVNNWLYLILNVSVRIFLELTLGAIEKRKTGFHNVDILIQAIQGLNVSKG